MNDVGAGTTTSREITAAVVEEKGPVRRISLGQGTSPGGRRARRPPESDT